MLDPYRMVITSLAAFFVVTIGIVSYQYLYPKKTINLFVLILLFSLPAIISIFRPGSYESGDFTIHIYRTISFYHSIQEGHFLPSWAAELNSSYGYPLFIFNYTLPYYFISFFHLLGFSFIFSMKLFLALCFIFSGVSMYLCTNMLFKNDRQAFLASIFYQFTPYHLIALHFKIVVGELLIFIFLPLVLYSLQKFWKKRTALLVVTSSISVGLLILSHVVIALFSMMLIFCYGMFLTYKKRSIKYITRLFIVFLLGSAISCYIWLPPFFLTQYTRFSAEQTGFIYFPQLFELFYSPWRLGFLFQGPKGQLSFLLGYSSIITILFSFIVLLKGKIKKSRPYILFWTIALFVTVFLITPQSKFLWGIAPFIKNVGSQRLLILCAFIISLLAGYVSIMLNKTRILLYSLILFTILSTVLNWGHRRVIPTINDQTLINGLGESTAAGEGHFYANSKWVDPQHPWFSKPPTNHLEILHGTGDIKNLTRSQTTHSYLVSSSTFVSLRENTLYFPGWKITDNNHSVPINYKSSGLILFTLPPGIHHVTISYSDVTLYRLTKIISVTSIMILFLYLTLNSLIKNNKLSKAVMKVRGKNNIF